MALERGPSLTEQAADEIRVRIVRGALQLGESLSEIMLAKDLGVSKTPVREALMQLQARGFLEVRPRRGWYVVEPSVEDARDAFSARRIIESGILADVGRPLQSVIPRLRAHIADEQQAIEGADAATRAFLLADFHVCLAEAMGHRSLSDILRDLTARTTLAASLYQSRHEASQSCAEHAAIVEALEAGDTALARERLLAHIGHVEAALNPGQPVVRDRLRESLAPLAAPRSLP